MIDIRIDNFGKIERVEIPDRGWLGLDTFVTSIPEDVLPVAEEEADCGNDHAEDDGHDSNDHV